MPAAAFEFMRTHAYPSGVFSSILLCPGRQYCRLSLLAACAVLCNAYDVFRGQANSADQTNTPHRIALLQHNDGLVKTLLAGSLVLVLYSLAILPRSVLQLFVPGIVVTSAYWLPLMPGGCTIKEVPGAKNVFTASVETLALVGFAVCTVPSAAAAAVPVGCMVATVAFCVLINTALALLADVRDVEGDRLAGTLSVAVLYGVPAALQLAGTCCLAAVLVALLGLPHAWAVCGSPIVVMTATSALSTADASIQRSFTVAWRVLDSWFHALVGVVGLLLVVAVHA